MSLSSIRSLDVFSFKQRTDTPRKIARLAVSVFGYPAPDGRPRQPPCALRSADPL